MSQHPKSIRTRIRLLLSLLIPLLLCSCTVKSQPEQTKISGNRLIAYSQYSFKIINRYPHDTSSFTQGLIFHDGYLYETTGLRRQSKLMKVKLSTGKAIRSKALDDRYFGEGMTLLNGKIYQVTLDAKIGFIYDPDTLEQQGTFPIQTSGWGLTHNGKELILSDGTDTIYFIDPRSFKVVRTINVFNHQGEVAYLNELEYVDGLILANIWYRNEIVAIDPRSGKVVSTIDINGLSPNDSVNDVPNGIAYDQQNHKLYLTGKRWSQLFEVELVAKK